MRYHLSKTLIGVALLGRAASGTAQLPSEVRLADSVRVAIEAAVDAGELKGLDNAVALADRAITIAPGSALLLHYRAYALYRAGTLVMGRSSAAQARPYFDKARAVLEPLVKGETIPESYALLASVYGMQIAVSRFPMFAGMQLGSRSSAMMKRAVVTAPHNPRVLLMQGIADLHTPSSFGGGLDKAEPRLKQAIALFAVDHPAPPLPAWGLADAHIWLGQLYAQRKMRDSARAEYNAALAVQPHNGWIVQVLIPSLDKIHP